MRAPTLLIVGGADPEVLELNREALGQLRAEKELVVVPAATHLFEDPGALEEVGRLAEQWFLGHPILPRAAAGFCMSAGITPDRTTDQEGLSHPCLAAWRRERPKRIRKWLKEQ